MAESQAGPPAQSSEPQQDCGVLCGTLTNKAAAGLGCRPPARPLRRARRRRPASPTKRCPAHPSCTPRRPVLRSCLHSASHACPAGRCRRRSTPVNQPSCGLQHACTCFAVAGIPDDVWSAAGVAFGGASCRHPGAPAPLPAPHRSHHAARAWSKAHARRRALCEESAAMQPRGIHVFPPVSRLRPPTASVSAHSHPLHSPRALR